MMEELLLGSYQDELSRGRADYALASAALAARAEKHRAAPPLTGAPRRSGLRQALQFLVPLRRRLPA